MSRRTFVIASLLFAAGALFWLLATQQPSTEDRVTASSVSEPSAPQPSETLARDTLPEAPATAPAAPVDRTSISQLPAYVRTRGELLAELTRRGEDADAMLAAYREWRVSHGYFGTDPLSGIEADSAEARAYAELDRQSQKSLADAGSLGALQAYAAGSLPGDTLTALEAYGQASQRGSAAALTAIASLLDDMGTVDVRQIRITRPYAASFMSQAGAESKRDARLDSAAWTLAAIRLYGPIPTTASGLEQVEELARTQDPSVISGICAQSLTIMANLTAAAAGGSARSDLPPVFVSEANVYDRLPCRNTPAPVTPPRALANCAQSPAVGPGERRVELWICPEN